MQDFIFYNTGCAEPKGLRRVVLPARRLLRRILRPIFQRLVELLQHLSQEQEQIAERQDQIEKQVQALLHLGWDYLAVISRLALVENQLAERAWQDRAREASVSASIPISPVQPEAQALAFAPPPHSLAKAG